MLANSLNQINTLFHQGFLYFKNKINNNLMKKLQYLFIFILLAFGTSQVYSQNISVYPSYPPTAICEGDQVTFIIDASILPSGKTLAYYKFWCDKSLLPYGFYMGKNLPNSGLPTQYQFPSVPPGVYTGSGEAVSTDSTHYSAGTISYTVYYRPIVDFSLTTNSLDTQCLNGNSFCFVNNSKTNTSTPSNPIISCFWQFGDGAVAYDCNPIVCHTYAFVNQFNAILKVTDDHGCSNTKFNPSGHDSTSSSNGMVVVNSANPNFSWVQVNGYCFQTCYRFKNLSILTIDKVKRYQWDFGDSKLCDNWWEPDSNLYTGTIPALMNCTDTATGRFDSAHYDTITHCYCEGGAFRPKLSISNIWGCTDSLRKTPSNSGGKPIPSNINFTFDVTTTTQQGGNILADSVCVGSGNSATICYKQTIITGVQPGGMGQGFIWDFGDPADPNKKNFDSMSWTPCHVYSGMGSFFPSLTVQCHPDTTFYYYAAKVVGPYRRFIDTTYDNQRDLIDPTKISSTVSQSQVVKFRNRVPIFGPSNPAFDGQAMVINAIDSVQMQYVGTFSNWAKYKMLYKNKYYGDTAYYFNTQPFTSPYPPYQNIRPDSIPVYQYSGFAPLPNFFVPPPIANQFLTIQDSIVPLSFPTGQKDLSSNANPCLGALGIKNKAYYYNTIVDGSGSPLNTFWYKYSRSYNYGVRVLGPFAQIENPPVPVVISAAQKQQCGPDDTVDFVNTSASFKSRNIWRRWDFGDVYAPQCTSFSVPHFPHNGMYSWPPVVSIDSFAYYRPLPSSNDYLKLQDELVIMYDTIRMWSDAIQQDRNSDHFFISNGVTYQGKRNCNFSHDTLPRHVYPNWDTVYLWYRYGHDFMPWNKALPGSFWTRNASLQGANGAPPYVIKDWDTSYWGKPVYLNILTGAWSLYQDSSVVYSYVDTIRVNGKIKYIERDTFPGVWRKWTRIDTIIQSLPPANQLPKDLQPGNGAGGINPGATQIPDPFQMGLGNYTLFSGISIDTLVHFPPKMYPLPNGQRITLPDGKTLLPGSKQDFFEYMFRRVIQKCITVKLRLTDSLNNESRTVANRNPSYFGDGDTLDIWDCTMESTVILALGKPDARGMGKQPKECPGLNGGGTQGYPALRFDNQKQPYPGFKLECGNRTSIWIDIDSLADRLDFTPCYLDGFTSWGVGTYGTKIAAGPGVNVTPGGLTRNTFYTGMNWNPLPPSPWTSASGSILQYHMGANAGTPPAADSLVGYVTIGVFIGNGQKDSTIKVWKTNYLLNQTNNGQPLRDSAGKIYSWNPADPAGLGLPWTYQNFLLIDQIANRTTPPPVPIPAGWVDDSLAHTYAFNTITNRVPLRRTYDSITYFWDTLYTLQYLDPNWPRCISDTVWYHNFWRIKELNAAFAKSPIEISIGAPQGPSYLREREDTIWVMYADSVQDSVKNDVWDWGDNIVTADSFYFAGYDTTNSYYTHGVRRVRYNVDMNSGYPGVLIDSVLWPCGVYGDRQYIKYVRYYKRYWDSIGFIAPDILMLLNKCTEPSHAPNGFYPDSANRPLEFVIAKTDTAKLLPHNALKYFDLIGLKSSGDSLILRGKNSSFNPPQININVSDTALLDKSYLRCLQLKGSTPPSTLIYTLKTLNINYPVNIHLSRKDTVHLPITFRRFLDSVGFIAPDTIVFRSVCPNPNHSDYTWGSHGYTNYQDTFFMRMRDTSLYTQSVIVDTSLMQLPLWHVYHKTSWEIALQRALSVNTISALQHFMTNSQNCQYNIAQLFTVGIIDTLHIFGSDWVEDTVFCRNEPAHFIDSLRYWRYDNTLTDNTTPNWATSRPSIAGCPAYHDFNYGANEPINGYPWDLFMFDTIDFWARDSINPLDTLVNFCSLFSNSQIEFRYFPGQWTNYDGTLAYLPASGAPLTGHWDAVLRGGSTKAIIPTSSTDKAYENVYPGMVIFYPVTGALGSPGLYTWDPFGYWVPCFSPLITFTPLNTPNYDTLNSLTDISRAPVPTVGRTILYNNGKGAYKKVGMYYWGGSQWVFISNNQYTSFPFYTHRVYWDFGDGTPIICSTKPTHQFQNFGRFKVSMISRDSIGHFDTCVSFVEVMKPVAKIFDVTKIIGCKDTASFFDSSFVITGANDTNTFDYEISRKWWFTIRYFYPNGLQGQDTLTPNSVLQHPIWYFNQKGAFKIKLAILTQQGCMDTVTDSLIVQGPRPAFRLITDTIGCKPYRLGIWNMADSFGMRSAGDTPTLSTFFYWGDGQYTPVTGRRDTVWHTYTDTGTYKVIALGRDALPLNQPSCPIAMTPDTVNGFERAITIIVKQPYHAKINVDKDTVCVGQPFDVFNTSDSLNYSAYRYERWMFDSAQTSLSFITKDSIYGTSPLKNVKLDSVKLYRIILIPTNYQPSVPKAAQCALNDTITIRALKPKAMFSIDSAGQPIYKFTNASQAADYYQWIIYQKDGITPRSDGQKTVYPPNVNYQYDLGLDTGIFKVCLIAYTVIPNYPEKCNDTTCQMVSNIYTTKIVIPNVFTPNGDDHNDYFKIDILGEFKYDMMIYNRWGTKVFTSTDKNNMWNGKDNNTGADCADGTYFYIFTYQLKGHEVQTVHGTVTLIRE